MDLGKTLAESRTYSRLCFQESVAFPMLTTLDLVDPLAKGDGTLTASEVKDALDQVGWVRCNGHPRCWFGGYGVADENTSEEADKYWPKLKVKLCSFPSLEGKVHNMPLQQQHQQHQHLHQHPIISKTNKTMFRQWNE